jgi:hypothetical protein
MANTAAQTYVGATGPAGATGAAGASGSTTYAGSLASSSSVAVSSGNQTYLLTGTTGVTTATGGTSGSILTLIASGQATGVCVVLNNGGSSNNLSLRDSANLGIYAGESVTFMYDGTKWVETSRNVKTALGYTELTANTNVTATSEATATTLITSSAFTFDGSTAIEIRTWAASFAGGTNWIVPVLYDGTSIGLFAVAGAFPWNAGSQQGEVVQSRRIVPTAASHTYSLRAYVDAGTGSVKAGAGGSGAVMPAYMEIRRAL